MGTIVMLTMQREIEPVEAAVFQSRIQYRIL